eukprot:TRINITY_DN3045_c0_g1::TRINITY_DN3045_c0_g1_i1::g.22368::m.22368 TRINITY_DN3045_c0_g1::TRINITY_DN3045_c0_g1_i1::g.22368  ORF type:complete len:233 (+),score=65.62,sp/Q5ZXE0/MIP_LEGPH/65.04/3e-47,FKBP_C/PF00254.23/3.5e+02,FKBP_C/PF00254.23/2.9e-25,FKBP_N/PF01346.13/1.2e-09,FKBP_N/PF01346.13/2.3e+02 TRINITY_DN3045_c0_g1_i1:33-701(+)
MRFLSVLALLFVLLIVTEATDYSKYNARVGKKFLAENALKEGVVTLPSGLQYKVITKGSGTKSPGPSDTVKVHYSGRLIDGTEFDSSITRGEPATFPVNGVIKGWTEALQLMVPGDTWELYIPSDLAYGAQGAGKDIGPNSTLLFKVELIDVMDGKSAKGTGGGRHKPASKVEDKEKRKQEIREKAKARAEAAKNEALKEKRKEKIEKVKSGRAHHSDEDDE